VKPTIAKARTHRKISLVARGGGVVAIPVSFLVHIAPKGETVDSRPGVKDVAVGILFVARLKVFVTPRVFHFVHREICGDAESHAADDECAVQRQEDLKEKQPDAVGRVVPGAPSHDEEI